MKKTIITYLTLAVIGFGVHIGYDKYFEGKLNANAQFHKQLIDSLITKKDTLKK